MLSILCALELPCKYRAQHGASSTRALRELPSCRAFGGFLVEASLLQRAFRRVFDFPRSLFGLRRILAQ
jgi:hypothetical protein